RKNAVIDLGGMPSQHWLDYLAPERLGRFVVEVLARTIPFATIEANVILLALLVLVLLGLWFWRGDRLVRLGLAWTVLHLAFIYWVLWTQKPEYFAGRHIYNAWIGFTLALSVGIDWFLRRKRLGIGDWGLRLNLQSPISNLQSLTSNLHFRQTMVGVVVVAVVLIHAYLVQQFQAGWLTMTQEQANAARQMKQLLPGITDVHVFAYRFAIKPDFLPSFAEVWYGATPLQPAGSFNQLQRYGRATDNFYLLDYEDGRVYNLMPELQAHEQTFFLWSQAPRVEIIGPGGATISGESAASFDLTVVSTGDERRLALPTQPPQSQGNWLSLVYVVTVPEQSHLRFSLHSTGRMAFRVRLLPASGEAQTLYETGLEPNDQGWTEVVIPMAAYGGQPVALRLETAGDSSAWGYWANPRFVIGDCPMSHRRLGTGD
ncbi:MAG TPA: hypothetical protein VF177_08290, partial [Anaerolineae bacterium]